jgi:hypothetical protein
MTSSTCLARLAGPVLAEVGLGTPLHRAQSLALAADELRSPALPYPAPVIGLLGGVVAPRLLGDVAARAWSRSSPAVEIYESTQLAFEKVFRDAKPS